MVEYLWKRKRDTYPYRESQVPDEWEYLTTYTPEVPPGGWQRVYAFGIGRVQGAGGSPGRRVNGNA